MDDKETYLKAIHKDLMWIRQITVGEFINVIDANVDVGTCSENKRGNEP